MKPIPLTQGKFSQVDDENYEELNKYRWFAAADYKTFYAKRSININGKIKTIYMHRQILNTPKGKMTDHIDCNGLNNQKNNLRVCSCSENQRNSGKRFGFSKYKGVGWHKSNKKWQVRIVTDGKRKFVGHYSSEFDAARAYNDAAIKHFGEFAKINNIE